MAHTPERAALHIADLKRPAPAASMGTNFTLPSDLFEAIERLAKELKASRNDVVIALLNAGLEEAARKRRVGRR